MTLFLLNGWVKISRKRTWVSKLVGGAMIKIHEELRRHSDVFTRLPAWFRLLRSWGLEDCLPIVSQRLCDSNVCVHIRRTNIPNQNWKLILPDDNLTLLDILGLFGEVLHRKYWRIKQNVFSFTERNMTHYLIVGLVRLVPIHPLGNKMLTFLKYKWLSVASKSRREARVKVSFRWWKWSNHVRLFVYKNSCSNYLNCLKESFLLVCGNSFNIIGYGDDQVVTVTIQRDSTSFMVSSESNTNYSNYHPHKLTIHRDALTGKIRLIVGGMCTSIKQSLIKVVYFGPQCKLNVY